MTDHDRHRAAVNKAWAKWQEEQAARSPLWRRAACAVFAGIAGGVFVVAVLYHIAN